jgi:hypothetical protein
MVSLRTFSSSSMPVNIGSNTGGQHKYQRPFTSRLLCTSAAKNDETDQQENKTKSAPSIGEAPDMPRAYCEYSNNLLLTLADQGGKLM